MKKLLISLVLIISSITLFAQDFDVYVRDMNAYVKPYSSNQIAELYNHYYGVPQKSLIGFYNDFGKDWGNVALALELSQILGIPMPDVFGVYRDGHSQGQGWGVMAKRYGIKPGSPAFHRMKNSLKKSNKNWGGIFSDYGKNKNAQIAKKSIFIYDNGIIKPNNKGDKKLKSLQKNVDKRNKNDKNTRRSNKENRGKGNAKKMK